jgi:Bacteriophage lambda head decoration protein D
MSAPLDLTVAMPSDWLKWEEGGWLSRENGILLAGQGGVLSGQVLAKDANGKLVVQDPAGTGGPEVAVGILFESAPISTVDLRVAYIARHAIVADKALRFKSGTTAPQKTTVFTALKALGIQVREGV